MRCEKHPNYKGKKPTKRDCPTCKALREKVLETKNKGKKDFFQDFISLTTPGLKVSSFHILAEVSCLMLFGKLPPYFWRQGTNCSQKIRDHYKQKMSYLFRQRKIRGDVIRELDSLLWLTWAKDLENAAADKVRSIENNVVKDDEKPATEINPEAQVRQRKKNIWEELNG